MKVCGKFKNLGKLKENLRKIERKIKENLKNNLGKSKKNLGKLKGNFKEKFKENLGKFWIFPIFEFETSTEKRKLMKRKTKNRKWKNENF